MSDIWLRTILIVREEMLLFLISSKGSFIWHHSIDRIAHSMAFVIPVVEHWLQREIAQ